MKNEDVFKRIRELNKPVYVWGNGEIGKLSKNKLQANNIDVAGFVVDKEYLKSADAIDRTQLTGEFIIIIGFLSGIMFSYDKVKAHFPGCVASYSLAELHGEFGVERITKEYYQENEHLFNYVNALLCDELSKNSYQAFLKSKIYEDNEYIYPFVVMPQYFFENQSWIINSNEVMLDGGAFTGDSITDFIKFVDNKYDKIYAVEPDVNNMAELQAYCCANNIKNIEYINAGLSNEKGVLPFDSRRDMMSSISNSGNDYITVNSIDNIVQENPCSIIKMDIEGFELNALLGAVNVIKRCRPVLYISAYHKKSDTFEIIKLIDELELNYKWFFRCHKPLAIDAVLYGIPIERIK